MDRGDSELEQAQKLIRLEVAKYLAEDRNWQEPAGRGPAAPRGRWPTRWPRDVVQWWMLHSMATDYARNVGQMMLGISIKQADDESDPRGGLLLGRVTAAAVAHAMDECRRHFTGAGRLTGKRAAGVAEREQLVAEALRAGLSVAQAAASAGVSRATAYRISKRPATS